MKLAIGCFLLGLGCGSLGMIWVLSMCRAAGRADECAECLHRNLKSLAPARTNEDARRAFFLPSLLVLACSVGLHADEPLLDKIAKVESRQSSAAVGDGGRALGAWQMHRAAWDDACRRLGVSWPHKDATSPDKARAVAREHLRWLHAGFTAATRRQPTPADSYALWNLGVRGYERRGWDITRCPIITRRAAEKL